MAWRFSRSFETSIAPVRRELLADPRLAGCPEIPLPTLTQAAKMAAMAVCYLSEKPGERRFGNRMWMYGAPRQILIDASIDNKVKQALQELGFFSPGFIFSRVKSPAGSRPADGWDKIVDSYRAFCTAIIDFLSRPPEEHSPLAMFVGEMLLHPPGKKPAVRKISSEDPPRPASATKKERTKTPGTA